VASDCALKSIISKTKGTRCGIGSLGKRKVVRRHVASSLSECGWASDGGARSDDTRSGGGGAAGRSKETTTFGLSGLAIGPQDESFWASAMKFKGKM
jgi:hypothetical protein